MDYKKIGLKAGIEIHQRLKTHKLFCSCSSNLSEKEPTQNIKRKLRAVAGEMGEVDRAAAFEMLRDKNFIYQTFKDETCNVEIDEEPPHSINEEALKIAIEISMLLNCDIVDEIHIMRKTVIDGSNTSGFQRTAVVGLNGWIKDAKKNKVKINHLLLEEESATPVSRDENSVTYRLDRLGIPLVEIATGLLVNYTPEEIQEIAYKIGMTLRSTGKIMRGIGSIRQDVNVSIKDGARVEIKGVQELGLISKVIENEVKRQISLIEIKKELANKIKNISSEIFDVTDLFRETECKLLKSIVSRREKIFAVALPQFSGMLKRELFPGKTLGRELSDYAVSQGVKGIIHTDEDLKKYQLENDIEKVKKNIKAKSEDCIVIVGGPERVARNAIETVLDRARKLLLIIPEETRVANPDGTTTFSRPLPGAARIYPETDEPTIKVEKKLLKQIKKQLPEVWEKKIERFRKLGMHDTLINQLLRSEYLDVFENIIRKYKISPTLVANFFTNILVDLRKNQNIQTEKITDSDFNELFKLLSQNKIVKESLPELVIQKVANPEKSFEQLLQSQKLVISEEELKKIISSTISSNKNLPKEKIIGLVMSKVRGKVDPKKVVSLIDEMM